MIPDAEKSKTELVYINEDKQIYNTRTTTKANIIFKDNSNESVIYPINNKEVVGDEKRI